MRTDNLFTALLVVLGLTLTALADQRSAERQRRGGDALCDDTSTATATPPPLWTDDEARELWDAYAPRSARGKKMKGPIRTEHYIVLTNSSCGAGFAKTMEENYHRIRDLYPFNEAPGARLMPILLFRTPEEFRSFLTDSLGYSSTAAKKIKGIATGTLYATWYESPRDPIHLHEATHQIFTNRIGLTGGGAWLQEGLAEYASTSKNERNAVATRIAGGKGLTLLAMIEMVDLADLGTRAHNRAAERTTSARERYLQAALYVEFFKESAFARGKFAKFLRAAGTCPSNDLEAIDAALLEVFGEGVSAIDRRFVEWCRKR
jgi:hypothetical protein